MRRSLLAGLGVLVGAFAIGAGILASETASSTVAGLEARLMTTASALPEGWSVSRGATSMDELSVPAWYRCLLPPSSVFGEVIANEQFRSRLGERASETIGMATTTNPTGAVRLWRSPWHQSGRCLHGPFPRRTRRVITNAYFAIISPFETGAVGWTGYSPQRWQPFPVPEVRSGTPLFRSGFHLTDHETWIFYGVLKGGYVVEVATTGRLNPAHVANFVDRLTSAL